LRRVCHPGGGGVAFEVGGSSKVRVGHDRAGVLTRGRGCHPCGGDVASREGTLPSRRWRRLKAEWVIFEARTPSWRRGLHFQGGGVVSRAGLSSLWRGRCPGGGCVILRSGRWTTYGSLYSTPLSPLPFSFCLLCCLREPPGWR
jgi:hypothetical protein